jgi:hypothetical protein
LALLSAVRGAQGQVRVSLGFGQAALAERGFIFILAKVCVMLRFTAATAIFWVPYSHSNLLRLAEPNYAIKVTSVKILVSSFASGASAPYFGC